MSARQLQPRHARVPEEHRCHWPGCEKKVDAAAAQWGCKQHWLALPQHLRDEIWRNYRPGQETDKSPSRAYINAAIAARDWILQNHDDR